MGKKRTRLSHIEFVLNNGVRWRISLPDLRVWEIEDLYGTAPVVRGPVSIDTFIEMLTNERNSR